MQQDLFESKVESIRRCIERIESKKPFASEALTHEYDLQDIISVNLERAVQLCVDCGAHVLTSMEEDMPSWMAGVFEALHARNKISNICCEQMVKAVGLRNRLVHQYPEIDWEIVGSVALERPDDFKRYIRELQDSR